MEGRIKFGEHVSIAFLPWREQRFNERAMVAGWGNTVDSVYSYLPYYLRKLNVITMDPNECDEEYVGQLLRIRTDVICAHKNGNDGYGINDVRI